MVERARVVDEDVDRPELVDDALDRLEYLLPPGDVAAQRERAPAELFDLAGGRLRVHEPLRPRSLGERAVAVDVLSLRRLELDVGDRDVGARARKRQGVRPAQPSRSPGDERNPSREIDLNRHAAKISRGRSRAAGSA